MAASQQFVRLPHQSVATHLSGTHVERGTCFLITQHSKSPKPRFLDLSLRSAADIVGFGLRPFERATTPKVSNPDFLISGPTKKSLALAAFNL